MSNDGWIKIYRKFKDNWIWEDKEPFDMRSAWLNLILDANHKDNKVLIDGEIVIIKRGQILTSVRKLADQWKWSRSKVSRFIGLLENDGMIVKNSDNKKTLLTLVNYDDFQCQRDKKEPRSSHGRATVEPLTDTNKNVKNVKNVIIPPKSPKGDRGASRPSKDDLMKSLTEKSYSKEITETMSRWLDYRMEIGKTFKSKTGFQETLCKLDQAIKSYGEKEVIDLISYCMAQSWQGIIWDMLKKPKPKQKDYNWDSESKENEEYKDEFLRWLEKDITSPKGGI